MALSRKSKSAKQYFKKVASQNRSSDGLSKKQFGNLMEDFEIYANKHGFYRKRWQAQQYKGYYIYQWQWEIANTILRALFMQEKTRLNISIVRQVGKTEFVGLSTAYAFEKFFEVMGRPITIAIIAPEKDTASVPFQRTENYISKALYMDGGDTKKSKQSVRGDTIQLYGIYDEYKGSTIEGRSFDLVIRDEAHKGSDKKFIDEVEPATMSKKGCIVMIGNGGFKKCLFMEQIKKGNDMYETEWGKTRNVLVKYTYYDVKPYFEKLAAAGLPSAATSLNAIEEYIDTHGEESIDVRKNCFCEWMLEYGNPVTQKDLELCHDETAVWDRDKLMIGFDMATLKDRTIAAFMTMDRRLVDIYVVKDANEVLGIRDQCQRLKEYCDDKGYTGYVLGIGFDATGMGLGGTNEFLEENFSCSLVPYQFTPKSKHEWYVSAIEMIKNKVDDERLRYHPDMNNALLFETEWTELEVRELKTQKYKSFSAPDLKGKYDDVCAGCAIVFDMVVSNSSMYNFSKREKQKSRFETRFGKKKKNILQRGLSRYTRR